MFLHRVMWLVCCVPALGPAKAGELQRFPYDPVALVAGQQLTGREELSAKHYIHEYRFASPENRAAFLQDPQRYEIQMGGACARMGPLSGLGDPQRFAVHDGRIYVFASDACRNAFLSAPRDFLESARRPPAGDQAAHQRGRQFIEQALATLGGADAVDQVRSYREQHTRQVESRDKTVASTRTVTVIFPDTVRHDLTWGPDTYSKVLTPKDGWFAEAGKIRTMHPQQQEAMKRLYCHRNVIAMMQARKRADFVAVHLGTGAVPYRGKNLSVQRVGVAYDGTTTTLVMDPVSGRVHSLVYRGRGPDMRFGVVEKRFTAHRSVGGLMLPGDAEIHFEGSVLERDEPWPTITLNVLVDDQFLRRPPG